MTREEAKELLPIIQAYADGKTIEFLHKSYKGAIWTELDDPDFMWNANNYRIKPEPKYIPFKTKEECWQEMLKHQPFGWLKDKGTQNYKNWVCVDKYGIDGTSFDYAYKKYTFADGTPFGIKEE